MELFWKFIGPQKFLIIGSHKSLSTFEIEKMIFLVGFNFSHLNSKIPLFASRFQNSVV